MNVLLFFLLLFSSKDAFAYLDPGSGSFLLQAILGLFAAIGSFFVFYFNKVKNFFSKVINSFKKK